MRRKAFTITEFAISVLILSIMAAAVTMSSNASKQTARREAERVSAAIGRLIESADRTQSSFWIDVKDDRLEIRTGASYKSPAKREDFKATAGCSYSLQYTGQKHMSYNVPLLNVKEDTHQNFEMNSISINIKEEAVKGQYNIRMNSPGTKSECYVVLYENKS